MVLKINMSDKEKTWKIELEAGESLLGRNIGDKINGKDVKAELEGYELEIMGGSDISGFPMSKDVEGLGLKRVLFTKGWGMHDSRKGVRLRKSVRGKTISETTAQLNMKIIKHGAKKLEEIFPEQVKKPEAEKKEDTKEEVKEGN